MQQNNKIKNLYRKYLNRSCTDKELEELFELLKKNEELYSLKDVLKQEWEENAVYGKLDSLDWDTFIHQIEEKKKENSIEGSKKINRFYPVSIAAGILFIIGFCVWFWLFREQVMVFETGYGETREIVLSDESIIKLNANTIFKWEKNWKRKGIRKVEIEGEAFFDVAHNDEIPFQVVTPDLTVNVTGTSFNVTNRRHQTDVFLESGKVNLRLKPGEGEGTPLSPGGERSDNTKMSDGNKVVPGMIEMVPGDLLSYSRTNNKMIQKQNSTTKESASWKTGSLIYEDTELWKVLEELHDVYGKSFEVRDSVLLNMKVDVGVPYSDWKTVLGLMKFMVNAEFIEQNEKVIIK